MERITHKLASSLPGLIVRGAGEVHKRPSVAAVLYAALAGVLASPFGGERRSLRASGRNARRGSSDAEGVPEPAQTSMLRELERSHSRCSRLSPSG
ncbi:MAG: hypothetical protein M3P37_08785 [Actinomycetota bacterium]|nr:hypothetical protein [Actinomycetota bacterium]